MSRAGHSLLDTAKGYEVIWPQVANLFEIAAEVDCQSYVYFIGEVPDGPIKIGWAKDPLKRLRNMQTGNPRRLRVEYVLMGGLAIEKLLHEMWEPFAIRSAAKRDAPGTEWFESECRGQLLPIIKAAAEQQVAFTRSATEDFGLDDMEQVVRDAHKAHDFIVQGRDEIRLLTANVAGGYVVPRASRI